ncbi:MAG: ribonuclease HII [Candidatus Aenigmatarchaeota archaeon]
MKVKKINKPLEFSKFSQYKIICGIDEVGLGAIAGPIIACSVILDLDKAKNVYVDYRKTRYYIIDSKQIPKEIHEEMSDKIKEVALCYSFGVCEVSTINQIKNIWICGHLARQSSLDNLLRTMKPELVLVDGNFKIGFRNYVSVVGGDRKCLSIAAASILAKNFRDSLMKKLSQETGFESWKTNSGYRSRKHYKEIQKYGLSEYHRIYLIRKEEKL